MTSQSTLQLSAEQWAARFPVEPLQLKPFENMGLQVFFKREDQLDPVLSGNKLYKLYGHLQRAKQQGATCVVSFGGAYSNHLHALAAAARALGLASLGIVRAHVASPITPTLRDCLRWGMELVYVNRESYRRKTDLNWVRSVIEGYTSWKEVYVIPEGGSGQEAAEGLAALYHGIRGQMGGLERTSVCVPCGTGTTMAGFLAAARAGESVLGFSALKLGDKKQQYCRSIEAQVEQMQSSLSADWQVFDQYHWGGFGKCPTQLKSFMDDFTAQTAIPLDPVYTAKMLYGIIDLCEQGYWAKGHSLVVVHTGGLQGCRGIT